MSLIAIPFQPIDLRPPDYVEPADMADCPGCELDPAPCLEYIPEDEVILQLVNGGVNKIDPSTGAYGCIYGTPAVGGITTSSLDTITNLSNAGGGGVQKTGAGTATGSLKNSVYLFTTGRSYRVRVTISSQSAGSFTLSQNGTTSQSFDAAGVYDFDFEASGVAQQLVLSWDSSCDAVVTALHVYDATGNWVTAPGWTHEEGSCAWKHTPGNSSAFTVFSARGAANGFGIFVHGGEYYAIRYRVFGRSAGTLTLDPTGSGANTFQTQSNGEFTDRFLADQYGIPSWTASSDFDGYLQFLDIQREPREHILQVRNMEDSAVEITLNPTYKDGYLTCYGQYIGLDDDSNPLPDGCYQVAVYDAFRLTYGGTLNRVGDPTLIGSPTYSIWSVSVTSGSTAWVAGLGYADLARQYGIELTAFTGQVTQNMAGVNQLLPSTAYTCRLRMRPALDSDGVIQSASGTVQLTYGTVSIGSVVLGTPGVHEFTFVTGPGFVNHILLLTCTACNGLVIDSVEIYQQKLNDKLLSDADMTGPCMQLKTDPSCLSQIVRATCFNGEDGTDGYAFGFQWNGNFALVLRAPMQYVPKAFDGQQNDYFGPSGTRRVTSARIEEVGEIIVSQQGAVAHRALAVMSHCERMQLWVGASNELDLVPRNDDYSPAWPQVSGTRRADARIEVVRRENAVKQLLRIRR
ncbi:MAG: hypothetical protein ACO1HP_07550 [Bacteroidota bacterium]